MRCTCTRNLSLIIHAAFAPAGATLSFGRLLTTGCRPWLRADAPSGLILVRACGETLHACLEPAVA